MGPKAEADIVFVNIYFFYGSLHCDSVGCCEQSFDLLLATARIDYLTLGKHTKMIVV